MQTLILEPVGSACNLRCSYCYQEPVREKIEVMSSHVLEKILFEAACLNEDLKFIWHGGEPLLAGIDFFKEMLFLQKKYLPNIKVVNSIQTNATLISEEWAEFLSKNGFRVSTSIDGPKPIHDYIRSNSFDRVIQGLRELKRFTDKIGVIITVHRFNVSFPKLIWEEMIKPKEFTNSFDVNIVSPTEDKDLSPSIEESFYFLKTLLDLWMAEDDPTIYIRSFMSILRGLKGGIPHLCAFEYQKCDKFLSLDNFGDVYMCNRFMKRKDAYLGNILQSSLTTLLQAKKDFYKKMVPLSSKCQHCQWLPMCGGGCAYYRWASTGKFDGDPPECSLRKQLFCYIKDRYLN